LNLQHKALRGELKKLDKITALKILDALLCEDECRAIYYNDIEARDQFWIEEKFGYSVSAIKKYKHSGYAKLVAYFSPDA